MEKRAVGRARRGGARLSAFCRPGKDQGKIAAGRVAPHNGTDDSKHSGGDGYGREETERSGSLGAVAEAEGMERGERQTASRDLLQRFRDRLWQHDPSGAGGGENGPPPGMVQRVEQSGD